MSSPNDTTRVRLVLAGSLLALALGGLAWVVVALLARQVIG
jgi:hypothetical protein